jgi:hypothetical protein
LLALPLQSVAHNGKYGEDTGQEPRDVPGAARDPTASCLASGRSGLAPPSVAVLALTAETKGLVGDSATRALATPLVGENDGESEIVHPNLPSLGAFRIVRLGADAPV